MAPFQDFASLLSPLAPSEAAEALHELQHALAGPQLALMPGAAGKGAAQGARRGAAHTKSPGVRKELSRKTAWLQKEPSWAAAQL